MPVPDWVDPKLSADLPTLRAQGEGQGMEYMSEFPQQARELGKEIAAFATSNPGLILLGITNDGDLLGLDNVDTPAGRDELQRRLEGICRGMVKPAITPTIAFAVEADKIVLVISVPRGSQPVYYCNHIPYVRHLTESRPADPHEVEECVLRSQQGVSAAEATPAAEEAEQRRRIVARLAGAVHDVVILADQLEERSVNPHLQDLRSQIAYAGEVARAIAATDEAHAEGISDNLMRFADAAEAVGSYRMSLGSESWQEFSRLVEAAAEHARMLDQEVVRGAEWPWESQDWAQRRLRELSRELTALAERADRAMSNGRVEGLQQAVATIGKEVGRLSLLGLRDSDPEWLASIRDVAKQLHLVDSRRLYIDGGRSWKALMKTIVDGAERLAILSQTADEASLND